MGKKAEKWRKNPNGFGATFNGVFWKWSEYERLKCFERNRRKEISATKNGGNIETWEKRKNSVDGSETTLQINVWRRV